MRRKNFIYSHCLWSMQLVNSCYGTESICCGECAKRHNMSTTILAIFLLKPFENTISSFVIEVNVYVWKYCALYTKEPFEKQIMFQWVYLCNP